MENFEEEFRKLPPALRQEVADFVEFLLQKQKRKKGKRIGLSWGGALSEYRDQYTSLELQKKALEWRGN